MMIGVLAFIPGWSAGTAEFVLFLWHEVKLYTVLFTIAENKDFIVCDGNSRQCLVNLAIRTICQICCSLPIAIK